MKRNLFLLSLIIFSNLCFAAETKVCFKNAAEHEEKKADLDPAIQKFPMYLIGDALNSNVLAGLQIVVDPTSKKIVLTGNTWQLTKLVAFAQQFVRQACVVTVTTCIGSKCIEDSKKIVIELENNTKHEVKVNEPKVIIKKDGSKIIIPQLTYISKKNVDLTPTDLAGYEKQSKNIEKVEIDYKAKQDATQNGTGI